jgi:hypothetical protein
LTSVEIWAALPKPKQIAYFFERQTKIGKYLILHRGEGIVPSLRKETAYQYVNTV